METYNQHVKFFRFGSSYVLSGEGSKSDLWLAESTKYIDISLEYLLKQYLFISYYSKGGFSFETISRLSYKQFVIVLNGTKEIQKNLNEEEGE